MSSRLRGREEPLVPSWILLFGGFCLACAAEGPGPEEASATGSEPIAGAPTAGGQTGVGAGQGGAGSQVLPSTPEGGGAGAGAVNGGQVTAGSGAMTPGVPTSPVPNGETTETDSSEGTGATIAGPSFSDVAFRMNASCATVICHTGPPYFDPVLSDARGTLYETLMNWVVEGCDNAQLIVPGDPGNSAFFMVLEPGRCPGVPLMPLECPECVTEEDLEVIRAWVAAGAMP